MSGPGDWRATTWLWVITNGVLAFSAVALLGYWSERESFCAGSTESCEFFDRIGAGRAAVLLFFAAGLLNIAFAIAWYFTGRRNVGPRA